MKVKGKKRGNRKKKEEIPYLLLQLELDKKYLLTVGDQRDKVIVSLTLDRNRLLYNQR